MLATDEADFVRFVTGSSARLLRTAYVLCGDHQLAEDAVQSALTSAYVSWRRVSRADSPEAYVRRMVVNQIFGWRRRARARMERPHPLVCTLESIESHETRVTEADLIWQAVHALPARQRAVVVLRYYEDMSEQDIAAVLGIAPGTVKSTASAALAHLRSALEDRQVATEVEHR